METQKFELSVKSVVSLQQLIYKKKSGFPFSSSKSSVWLQKACLWRRLECCMSLQAAGTHMMSMPWCTHSSHNAALPAAGLSGPPGSGILGVSACWYCGEEKKGRGWGREVDTVNPVERSGHDDVSRQWRSADVSHLSQKKTCSDINYLLHIPPCRNLSLFSN